MSKPITEKKYNEIHNFIRKNIGEKPAAKFAKAYQEGRAIDWIKSAWPKLETFEPWTLKYSTIDDLTKSKEDQLKDIYNKNPDLKAISDARMKTILEGNDVTTQELKDYYDFRNAQKAQIDAFNKKRYGEISDEYNKAKRAKEDGYFNTPLANEYAREQYLKGNKTAAYINEGVGKLAGASDFAPFPISLIGPIARTGQRIYSDQPLSVSDIALDIGGSFIPDIAEKPAKLAWQSLKQGKLRNIFDSKRMKQIENRIKAADDDAAKWAAEDIKLTSDLNLEDLNYEQITELYNKIKTPEIKKALADYWKARLAKEESRNFNELATEIANKSETMSTAARNKALHEADLAKAIAKKEAEDVPLTSAERVFDYKVGLKKPELEVKSGHLPKDQPLMTNGDVNTYYKDVPFETVAEYMDRQVEPSKINDMLYNAVKLGGTKSARSLIGGRLGQWDTFNTEPKDNIESNIKEVIKTYGNEWSLNEKPSGYYTEPLIREAYDRWKASLPMYEYNSWR